jgi:hypothetical protein
MVVLLNIRGKLPITRKIGRFLPKDWPEVPIVSSRAEVYVSLNKEAVRQEDQKMMG